MHFVYIDESVATTISRISKLGKEACGLVIGKVSIKFSEIFQTNVNNKIIF